MLNRKHTRAEIEKIRKAMKKNNPGAFKKGNTINKDRKQTKEHIKKRTSNLLGHSVSKQTREKIGNANRGEKNGMWKEEKLLKLYSQDWTDTLREAIRQRDDYICQECGVHQDELKGFYKKLDIHHIDYDKENCNPDNLISLCRSCHLKTNYNRDYWIDYFLRR